MKDPLHISHFIPAALGDMSAPLVSPSLECAVGCASISGGHQCFLQCEHEGCNATEGVRDFLPTPEDEADGWEDEPVALCPLHCEGRDLAN